MTPSTNAYSSQQPPRTDNTAWTTTVDSYDKIIAPLTAKASISMVEAVTRIRAMTDDSRILDVGAGTGSMERVIRQLYPHSTFPIIAFDLAPGMVERLKAHNLPNVIAHVGDATALDRDLAPDCHFTHAFGSFMIQFCGERQPLVCQELFRTLEPGGIAAISIGHGSNGADPWDRACRQLNASYMPYEGYDDIAWKSVDQLIEGMQNAGFKDIISLNVWANLDCSHEEWARCWMDGGHPIYSKQKKAWVGDPEDVRPVFERVLKEQFPDPGVLGVFSGIVIGRK